MNIIKELTLKLSTKQNLINDYFAEKFSKFPALFYNSVDLRHSSHKITAIDTNCYPAGFNNLSDLGKISAQNLAQDFFKKSSFPPTNSTKNLPFTIFIIPENHTRNFKYLENLSMIFKILQSIENTKIFIATFNPEIHEPTSITLENQENITLFPLQKISGKLAIKNDDHNIFADFAILNNDLTNGIPEILNNITTPLSPSTFMGWFQRTKSQHFNFYNQIAIEISDILVIDPWLISSFHEKCDDVNFKENIGLECLATKVESMLKKITEKYQYYQITDQPYCYIKADNGTYGMAVWSVSDPQEILEINKKERNKMNMLKGSTQTHKVMVQEGIITKDTINNNPCEPMIYMVNGQIAECLFRCNDQRNSQISLNASGASFFNSQNILLPNNLDSRNFRIYELIAKMASLASSQEFNNLNQQIL
jgi:glutamate--cysteine ligase